MMTIAKFAAVATIAAGSAMGAAQAQTVPNPANPAPVDAIATDGSPLPQAYVPASPYRGVASGRSVAVDPIVAPVGAATGAAGAAVGTAGNVVGGVLAPLGF